MQTDLFISDEVSIQTIIKELNVSSASISNWVASGELRLSHRGYITSDSYK